MHTVMNNNKNNLNLINLDNVPTRLHTALISPVSLLDTICL